MWLWLAEFANDSGVQQIMNHLNSTTLRGFQRAAFRSKILKARARTKRQVLHRPPRALFEPPPVLDGPEYGRLHAAARAICGPFFKAVLRNFVKRAFVSCNCQEAMTPLVIRSKIAHRIAERGNAFRGLGESPPFWTTIRGSHAAHPSVL